ATARSDIYTLSLHDALPISPGEPGGSSWPGDAYLHGGGTTWMPGAYDPELNTLYWGTSNPAPDFVGDTRPGDDLYTDCVLALDRSEEHTSELQSRFDLVCRL